MEKLTFNEKEARENAKCCEKTFEKKNMDSASDKFYCDKECISSNNEMKKVIIKL